MTSWIYTKFLNKIYFKWWMFRLWLVTKDIVCPDCHKPNILFNHDKCVPF